jgi:hypothetical protein
LTFSCAEHSWPLFDQNPPGEAYRSVVTKGLLELQLSPEIAHEYVQSIITRSDFDDSIVEVDESAAIPFCSVYDITSFGAP